MPLFVAAILGAFVQAAGTLVGKVLISLGIGYATFNGVDTAIAYGRDQLLANIGQLPGAAIGLLGILKVGVAISILTSAVVARMTLAGLQSGTVKRMVQR